MTVNFESLQELLQSEDFGDRLRALNEGRGLDLAERFELVCMAVSDPKARIRYDATSQLASVGKHDPSAAFALLSDRLLHDSETDVRAAAADSIGALKLTEAFDLLVEVYRSTNEWLLQFSIIVALGELGDRRGFEILAEALNHETELVKIAALGALGDLGDPRGLGLILPLVNNPDWEIRYRLAQALHQIGGPEARAALIQLSHDPVDRVAETARTLLAEAGD
ncbi:HEAT repeat domain-containing protein [Pseudanabaena sp. PCC 6802]|uniref:HEAT repeat domain-containing protein n=1 Tax=Pseudanabaena sp. PCC 6802 TaxID=118173 RepID=UPI0003499C70|nr:HEAT repeat domain-containing protein [Pseudanabaena sp. PCC 6802]